MSYNQYLALCKFKRIIPLREKAFNAMINAGFNFEKGAFNE
jgi:hypothetical protein